MDAPASAGDDDGVAPQPLSRVPLRQFTPQHVFSRVRTSRTRAQQQRAGDRHHVHRHALHHDEPAVAEQWLRRVTWCACASSRAGDELVAVCAAGEPHVRVLLVEPACDPRDAHLAHAHAHAHHARDDEQGVWEAYRVLTTAVSGDGGGDGNDDDDEHADHDESACEPTSVVAIESLRMWAITTRAALLLADIDGGAVLARMRVAASHAQSLTRVGDADDASGAALLVLHTMSGAPVLVSCARRAGDAAAALVPLAPLAPNAVVGAADAGACTLVSWARAQLSWYVKPPQAAGSAHDVLAAASALSAGTAQASWAFGVHQTVQLDELVAETYVVQATMLAGVDATDAAPAWRYAIARDELRAVVSEARGTFRLAPSVTLCGSSAQRFADELDHDRERTDSALCVLERSPDGRRVVCVTAGDLLCVLECRPCVAADDESDEEDEGDDEPVTPVVCATELVLVSCVALWAGPAATQTMRRARQRTVSQVSFSPCSRFVALAQAPDRVTVLDLDTLASWTRRVRAGSRRMTLSWAPSGVWLAVGAGGGGGLQVLRVPASMHPVWTPETHGRWPPRLRRAVRAFLLCWIAADEHSGVLHELPYDLLELILSRVWAS